MPDTQINFRPTAEKRRILLVEDEFINQEILKSYLTEAYEVLTADTGEEALAVLLEEQERMSLVLLDLNLPDMHGLDVLSRIKADARTARIPVIVMTADSEAEVACLDQGAVDFIPKPYPGPQVVQARVRRTIELSEDQDILRWTERDQISGLLNRDFFYRYAQQLDTFRQDQPADAVHININHFHMINDRYGKAYGDEVLALIGQELKEILQETEGIACRTSADSFLLYLAHREDYEQLLERISGRINEEDRSENRIRLRMGIYSCVDRKLDLERRFDRAKMASDTVRGSFNRAVGYYDDSMHESEVLAEQLIEDFPTAIREKQFKVYYQPKFSIRSEEPILSSAEALVRWQHPKLGLVSPGIFIPLFENNGLIQTLDYYVWSEAAAQVRDWRDRLDITLPVSVNVSRVDLYDAGLVDKLRNLVLENGLSFFDILLEITESAYTENPDQIIGKVNQLRQMGFRIEMDDFGSGYSSLNMLSTLPIDALKLDMQFVRTAFRQRKDTRLLEIMIRLAESFEVPTIAEGVETAEQVFTLKAMGCDFIQGYFFSKPLPADEFEAYLLAHRAGPMEPLKKPRRSRRDKFTYNALHDPLTGLYNYSAFDILFHDSDHDHIAVMIAEIDRFEEISREHGKAYTDRLICRVAEVLRKNFRSVDHLCRLQESEFAIIMSRVTSWEKDLVTQKMDNVARQLQEPQDDLVPIRLSVGVAFSDREKPDGDVFQDADAALQRLKEMRHTGYCFF